MQWLQCNGVMECNGMQWNPLEMFQGAGGPTSAVGTLLAFTKRRTRRELERGGWEGTGGVM
jgi:hypothetical protein